jgi:hypothetical protein
MPTRRRMLILAVYTALSALVTTAVLRHGYHSGWLWAMEITKWAWMVFVTLLEVRRKTPDFTRTAMGMLGVSFFTDFALLQMLLHSR